MKAWEKEPGKIGEQGGRGAEWGWIGAKVVLVGTG